MDQDLNTISVNEYYTTVLPERLRRLTFEAPAGLEDSDYSVQYDIDGTQYGMRISDGNKIEVVEGAVESPLATIKMNESAWRSSIQGSVMLLDEGLIDPNKMTSARLQKIRSLNGTLNLDLTNENGEAFQSTTIFNNTPAPEVTITLSTENYAKILHGELNGVAAFMSGKLKFRGDMTFLMKLSGLM